VVVDVDGGVVVAREREVVGREGIFEVMNEESCDISFSCGWISIEG